jgi:hypothetical protein
MENIGVAYALILNDPQLRAGLIAEAERGALEIDTLVRNQARRQRQIPASGASLIGRHGAGTIRMLQHWLAGGLLALAALLEAGATGLVGDAD